MIQTLARFLAVVFSLAPLVESASVALADAPSKYTIGAIVPLSGNAANFGKIAQRGIEMALEELSPTERDRIAVIYEDDGLLNTRSLSAARKLINVDKVNALLTWSSGTGLTVKELVEKSQIPHLSIASDPQVSKGSEFSFTYWPLASDEAALLHDYMVERGVRRVAMLSLAHNGVIAVRDAFLKLAEEHQKVSVVAQEEVAGDTTDFRGVLGRIKSLGTIDGLVPILFPGQLAVAIRQARALGIAAPLYGFETFEDEEELRLAAGLLNGAVYATGRDPLANFSRRYQERYPNQSSYTANQSYDIVKILVAASRNTTEPKAIISFIRSLKDFPAASGNVNLAANNQFRLPCSLKMIDLTGKPSIVR